MFQHITTCIVHVITMLGIVIVTSSLEEVESNTFMQKNQLRYLTFLRVFMDAMLKILLVILQFFVVAVCTKPPNKWLVLSSSKLGVN